MTPGHKTAKISASIGNLGKNCKCLLLSTGKSQPTWNRRMAKTKNQKTQSNTKGSSRAPLSPSAQRQLEMSWNLSSEESTHNIPSLQQKKHHQEKQRETSKSCSQFNSILTNFWSVSFYRQWGITSDHLHRKRLPRKGRDKYWGFWTW